MSKVTKIDYDQAMILLRDYKDSLNEDEVLALNDVATSYITNDPTFIPNSLRIKNKTNQRLRKIANEWIFGGDE